MAKLPDDGVYKGVPMDEYRAWPAPSFSTLKLLCMGGTPSHYKAALESPDKESDAKTLGRWAHMAVLEPHLMAQHQCVPPSIKRRAGTQWDALQAEQPDVTWYSPSEWAKLEPVVEQANDMQSALAEHPLAGPIIGESDHEVSFVWTDAETGIRLKGRLDAVDGRANKADYKTFANIRYSTQAPMREDEIAGLPWKWGYQCQVALYTDGYMAATKSSNPGTFRLIMQESSPPYGIVIANAFSAYDLRMEAANPDLADAAAFYKAGRAQYKSALRTIASCEKTGIWPGYDLGIIDLTIPRWAEPDPS